MTAYHQPHFEDIFSLDNELGRGQFAVVWRGTQRDTGYHFAIKEIDRLSLNANDRVKIEQEVGREVAILRDFDHPNIIRLHYVFDNSVQIRIIMELVQGGELFDRIVTRQRYSEEDTRRTCRTILEAIVYCHDRQVVHRDLKPENILLLSDESDHEIKIADFGFATLVPEEMPDSMRTMCGTLTYMAPDVLISRRLNRPYGPKVDLWSLGIITYILLGGYPPFRDGDRNNLARLIVHAQLDFPVETWNHVSPLARDFISSLLTRTPNERLSAREALQHDWFKGDIETVIDMETEINAFHQLRLFNAKRKLRSAVYTLQAVNRMRLLLENVRYEYTN